MKKGIGRLNLLFALITISVIAAVGCELPQSNNAAPDNRQGNSVYGAAGDSGSSETHSSNTNNGNKAKCSMTKAPEISGFALGQTVETIDKIYPGFSSWYASAKERQTDLELKANFIFMSTGSLPDGNELQKRFPSNTFIWHFMDDKLMAFVVKDDDAEESDEKVYTQKLAKLHGLPTSGWKFDKEGGADLNCSGFSVMITSGGQPGNGIMITDTAALKEKERRQK